MVTIVIQDYVTGREKVVDIIAIPRVGEIIMMKGKPWTVQEVAYENDADGDYQRVVVRVTS
jgi:hypothetical protein